MADRIDELLAAIDAGSSTNSAPLSPAEKALGYSRSYLSGPLSNLEDEAEAGIATALSNPIEAITDPIGLFSGPEYQNEVNSIRAQQQRFKDKTDYLDNVVEIGSSIVLNPLDKLGKLAKGAKYGATTLSRLFSNPVTQGTIAGLGAADGEDAVKAAGKGALFGTVGSAAGGLFGSVAQKAGREADRLKLSAFGITVADLNRQIKKLDSMGAAPSTADNVPILKTLEKAEKQSLISVDNDVLTNMWNLHSDLENRADEIHTFLSGVNDRVSTNPVFSIRNTWEFIDSLSGTAQDKAIEKFTKEYKSIIDQLGRGSLLDLQKAKVGLNQAWEKEPLGQSLIKAMREDLKEAIENRIDDAVKNNILPKGDAGKIKQLNREWGDLTELRDAFARRAGRDLGGDVVEDVFRAARTTEGMGTANIASAITGNPIYAIAGTGLNVARSAAGKNMLADTLREFQTPLKQVGSVFLGEKGPAPVTARSSIEILDALGANKQQQAPDDPNARIDKLLSVIEAAQSAKPSSISPGANGQILDDSYVPQGNPQDRAAITPTAARSSAQGWSIFPSAYGDTLNAEVQPAVYHPDNATQAAFNLLRGNNYGGDMQDIDVNSLVKAVIGQESGGRADALSPKGAMGLMQIMPGTARDIATELGLDTYDLRDAETNRRMGTYYLNKMLNKFGSPELALAAYNAGPGRVQGWIDKYGPSWDDIAAALSKIGAYKETRNYVPQVLARLQALNDVVEV